MPDSGVGESGRNKEDVTSTAAWVPVCSSAFRRALIRSYTDNCSMGNHPVCTLGLHKIGSFKKRSVLDLMLGQRPRFDHLDFF